MAEQLQFDIQVEEKEKEHRRIFIICPVCEAKLWYPPGNWRKIKCPGCGTLIGREGEL
jgi:LSD1 subclass zinc finger protein